MKTNLKIFWQSKNKRKLITAYIQGNIRNWFYFSSANFLIRKHIREQIEFRILISNPLCIKDEKCIECKCAIPALQMSNGSCGGDCYPEMMTKKQWDCFNIGHPFIDSNNNDWCLIEANIVLSDKDGEYEQQSITLYKNNELVKTINKFK